MSRTRKRDEPRAVERRGLKRAGLWVIAALVGALVLDWLLRTDTLPVDQVSFEGAFDEVSREELERAVFKHVQGNFLVVDLDTIKREVEALPWVHEAAVRRAWPAGIHVQFSEQEIVARWGKDAWLNRYGEKVRLNRVPDTLVGLPVLAGPDGSEAYVLETYNEFSGILGAADVRIARLEYGARGDWSIHAANGLQLVLSREQVRYRLRRFADVYRKIVAGARSDLRRVDLRYTNGFAVEWSEKRARPLRPAWRGVPVPNKG